MYFVYLCSLFIIFFHLLNWIRGKTPLISKNKITIPLLIFLSSQLISTFFSIDPHTSIFGYYSRLNGGLLSLISYSALFLILSVYVDDKFKQKIITYSLISGLFVSTYGILEHFGIDKNLWVQDVQTRVFSTLGQPNWLAAYLCILLPFALNRFIDSKKAWPKLFYFFSISTLYTCLLFTKSKSGLAAGAISITTFLLIYVIKNLKSSENRNFAKVAILAALFLFLSLSLNNPIKNYLFPPQNPPQIDQNSTINITPSEDIRKIVWIGSVDLWKRFPLFGTGPETFAYSYYWTRPASHNLTSEWDFLYNKAHNEYLNYLATTGTFGFLSYGLLIFSLLFLMIKSLSFNSFNLAIFTSFISILITNFAGFSVVITSLFFFTLPSLLSKPSPVSSKAKNKAYFFPLFIIFIYFLIKLLSFLVADLAYNQSQNIQSSAQLILAQNYINTALSLRPQEAIYHSQASIIAAKLNQPQIAATHSNQAVTLSPTSTNLWKERAQVFSLLSLSDANYFTYAIDALQKCTRLAPTDAKSFYLLGKFYDAASQSDLALQNYQQALELKPNYDHASFSLGETYFNQKNYSEAKKYFEFTLKLAPTNLEAQNYLEKITSLYPESF